MILFLDPHPNLQRYFLVTKLSFSTNFLSLFVYEQKNESTHIELLLITLMGGATNIIICIVSWQCAICNYICNFDLPICIYGFDSYVNMIIYYVLLWSWHVELEYRSQNFISHKMWPPIFWKKNHIFETRERERVYIYLWFFPKNFLT